MFKYGVSSGPFFPVFGPVFGPNTGKYTPEKTPYLDTFHEQITIDVNKRYKENILNMS